MRSWGATHLNGVSLKRGGCYLSPVKPLQLLSFGLLGRRLLLLPPPPSRWTRLARSKQKQKWKSISDGALKREHVTLPGPRRPSPQTFWPGGAPSCSSSLEDDASRFCWPEAEQKNTEVEMNDDDEQDLPFRWRFKETLLTFISKAKPHF